MALRKPAEKFEDVSLMTAEVEGSETTVAYTAPAANEEVAAPAPAAAPAPVPAVRTAGTVAVANAAAERAKSLQRELDEMHGASSFDYGNYDVYKGSNGEIAKMGSDEKSLGRWAQVRLLGWDDHHEISPGSQDKTSKTFVAYSKDGKTVDHVIGDEMRGWVGKSVNEYVDYLRTTEGFEKAKVSRYVDMAVAVLSCDSGDTPTEVIQVTLSQSSIPSFTKYMQALKDKARCVAMGLPGFNMPEDPWTFFMLREVVSANGNRWTKINFCTSLPAKL